jgi:hypothetical protein
MHITTIGLDIAKNVFQVHGIGPRTDCHHQPGRRRQVEPGLEPMVPGKTVRLYPRGQ